MWASATVTIYPCRGMIREAGVLLSVLPEASDLWRLES